MKKILRRGDILLFIIFLAAAGLIAAAPLVRSGAGSPGRVRITCRGEEYGLYPLEEDRTIEVLREGHSNVISIRNGTVQMESADCHNQICVGTGVISRTGETIVCLPNRVVVEILADGKGGESDDSIDAVVK